MVPPGVRERRLLVEVGVRVAEGGLEVVPLGREWGVGERGVGGREREARLGERVWEVEGVGERVPNVPSSARARALPMNIVFEYHFVFELGGE